jgi:NADPH:quinone reductase-like Zn-dependent oxidoreductase
LNVFVVTDQTLATTLGDREGVLASKIEELLPAVVRRFDVVAVHATTDTHPRIRSQLQEGGVVLAIAVPDTDQIGRHRRETLRMALAHGSSSRIVYMDFDHLLRWIENDAPEFYRLLDATAEYDCAVTGRGPRSLAAVPERLASTEAIVNHVCRLMTGAHGT